MKFTFLAISLLFSSLSIAGEKNVLFIVCDDLNCAISPYGDKTAVTPNLDRLAAQGVTFNRAYCQQAVCNPSRASFLTGKLPSATGVDDLSKHFRTKLPDVVTLPQAFLNDGYFTQCVGKIFHNMGDTKDRQSWSVDEYLHEGPHSADTIYNQMPKTPDTPKYKAPVTESPEVPDTAYKDGRITERAVDAILRSSEKGKPFFLAVGFWRPHLPFVAPKKYWDLYDPLSIPYASPTDPPARVPEIALHPNKEVHGYGEVPEGPITPELEQHLRHGYYASISFIDAQVGQLLDALKKAKIAKDTIIVFTSDHGYHLGEHDLWAKTTNFELDARVPLIIADPSRPKNHGTTTDSLAELMDLIPTLTELAGVPTPSGQHGASQVPAMMDPATMVKEYARTQHQHPFYGKSGATHMGYSLRTDRWRYTEWHNIKSGEIDDYELYDHNQDGMESVNVAQDNPDVLKELSPILKEKFQY
ncbi:MAG: iduronate-2-sulfatase [Verrucomicrobiales bacterium]|nr:iduronate-2-sulfatase [Verrucomicrobiales bacterium]